jgi:predicted lipoprotein with Yx(FWY)xxD motif
MKRMLALGTTAAALAALAGCGSSSKSTTTSTTAASAIGTSSSSAKSAYAGSSAPGASRAVLVSTKHGSAGTVLAVGPKKLTVYLFEGDKGSASTCSGACAGVWPPVRTTGTAQAGGAAVAADLGTVTRADGSKQVTYKGHPLYLFAKDKDQGDSYGQGITSFGSAWYVLAPSGNKIDHS